MTWTEQQLLDHENFVHARVSGFDVQRGALFGLSCIERALPVLRRAAETFDFQETQWLLNSIDKAWDVVVTNQLPFTIDTSVVTPCFDELAMHPLPTFEMMIVLEISASIVPFLISLSSWNDDSGYYPASLNLGCIGMLSSADSSLVEAADELTGTEIERQLSTLRELDASFDIDRFRGQYTNISLFGSHWPA